MSDRMFSIIVAGGSGSRMGAAIPKQFLPLANKPILVHTLERFLALAGNNIVLVLPASEISYWKTEILDKKISQPLLDNLHRITVVEGGQSRFQSVSNGLRAIAEEDGLVAVHDGVRPLIRPELLLESFEQAAVHKAVVLSVMLKDSARILDDQGHNKAIDRSRVRLMQTPQTFDLNLLKAAFRQKEQSFFTDDASVVEHYGHAITLIEGDYKNIKITTPEDLAMAEAFLSSQAGF